MGRLNGRGLALLGLAMLATTAAGFAQPMTAGPSADRLANAPMRRPDVPDAAKGKTDARSIVVKDAEECRWLLRNPGRQVILSQPPSNGGAGNGDGIAKRYTFKSGLDPMTAFSICEMPRRPEMTVLTFPPGEG